MVEPVDPGQGGIFDRFKGLPRLLATDQFGLVQADDGLGQGLFQSLQGPARTGRGADPAAPCPGQPQRLHQSGYRTACHIDPLPMQLAPYLAYPVDTEILLPHPLDLTAPPRIAQRPGRAAPGIACPGLVGMAGRRGNRQHLADWLDPESMPMRIDIPDHHLSLRSSSAWAKKAGAVFRISLARRSS